MYMYKANSEHEDLNEKDAGKSLNVTKPDKTTLYEAQSK